ncbi:alkaline phosphatase, partial [Candidatus Hodarchaeum mangrovi]
ILGGGRSAFTGLELTKMQSRGYKLVENRTELLTAQSDKIFGLFTSGDLPYESVRDRTLIPSLAEMTSKSLEILSKDPDGFFLMVEGGQIDWAGHVNNAANVALETIEFDKSVKIALEYVQTHENTILVVTADHETGGLAVISESLTTDLPAEENTAEENEQLRVARTAEIYTLFSSTGHTATNVPFYMYGRTLSQYNNSIIDNTDIFEIAKAFLFSDTGAPKITIHSPLNDTIYGTVVEVILSFNETTAWVGYSINDKSNLTVETTQFNLNIPEGTYKLNIYANDSFGNLGSAQVWFTFIFSQTTTISVTSTTTSATTSGFIFLPSILLIILIDSVRRKLIKKT